MPICPYCRAAMLPGHDGVHRCRRDPLHQFTVEAGPAPSAEGAVHCHGNMACPDQTCGAEMQMERPGVWRCIRDPRHVLRVLTPARRGQAAHRRLVAAAEKAGAKPVKEKPEGEGSKETPTFWLSKTGIPGMKGPLMPPTQSNSGPGDYCQPLGDIAGGSGSKSKQKKKPKKKPPIEPWGA